MVILNGNVVSRLKKVTPPAEPFKSKPINKMLGGGCSHNFNIPCSFSLHKTILDIFLIFLSFFICLPRHAFAMFCANIHWHWDQISIFSVFCHHGLFLFCKPIVFSRICRTFRDLAFGSAKTRFKTI